MYKAFTADDTFTTPFLGRAALGNEIINCVEQDKRSTKGYFVRIVSFCLYNQSYQRLGEFLF